MNCDKCETRFCSGDCTIQLKIVDTHTIAAIASEFMTNHRYQAWYDENCDNLGGTPAIWEMLSSIALEIIDAERKLRVDWGEYDWMQMIVELIDRMYTDGLDQKWGLVLVDILKDQDSLFESMGRTE